jgi:outer membrane protein OmpA-like peptidoglycan-associated protein/tetratricopeptide (TPR) repeat protein
MTKLLLLLTFTLFSISTLIGQNVEENENCNDPEKKVLKILKITNDSKASNKEKSMAYSEAVKLAPDNAYCRFVQAEYNFNRAQQMETAYSQGRITFTQLKNVYMGALNGYKKVIELCPEYSATPYYKIGFIYYMLNEKDKAVIYFKQFLEFKSNNPDRYPEDYMKWKKSVEEILPEMEAKEAFYSKPVPYNPKIVKNVSTKEDEFLPMISPDNQLLFYTRRADEKHLGDIQTQLKERFTVSERPNVKSEFNSGEKLSAPFNTNDFSNYGGVSLSLDNKEMFICACKQTNVYGRDYLNCDLYVTHFERSGEGGNDFSWTALENLGPNINTKDGWEAQPTLSADGNTLFFATYRANSQNTDIYYSTRQKDGTWTVAKPVPVINTPGHDKAPFLHQDSETMYFVSQATPERPGAENDGNFDMYYSRKDENGNWTTPVNLGYPINTKENEVGLIVSTDGHLAYFASDRVNNGVGGFDIYAFELYEKARPKKVAMIKGTITDDKGDPVKDATVEISYKDSKEKVELKVNGDDGKYAAIINLEKNEDVLVKVKKEGYSFDTKVIKKEEINKLKTTETTFIEEPIEMEIGEIEVGKTFTLDNILFATDSYELTNDSKYILDQFIQFLKENPTVTVTIEGHTDNVGDDERNLTLSNQRALVTMTYLIEKGIGKDRLQAVGYGETQPKVPNNSEQNRAINRRTDFKITGM